MTSDPPSQTLTVGTVRRQHARRHVVVIHGAQTDTVELPREGDVVFGRTHDADVRVDDRTLSRRHLRLSVGRIVRATDLDSHNGTRLRGQPLVPGTPVELVSGDVLEAGNTTFVFRDEDPTAQSPSDGAWAQAHALARRVCKTGLNVIIVGNPGAGRRTLGAQILGGDHREVDGRLLDEAVLDDATTSALPLLLLHCDEVPTHLQAPLARALEGRSSRTVATAARDTGVLAASLDFYLPLHRALSGVVLRLPPMDTCTDELPAIAESILRAYANRAGLGGAPRLAPDALEVLKNRAWPGELRSLAATLEASAVALRGPTITARDLRLPNEMVQAGNPDAVERQRIIDALAACGGNQTKAARLLKVSRRTLVSRLDRYGIARPRKAARAKKP